MPDEHNEHAEQDHQAPGASADAGNEQNVTLTDEELLALCKERLCAVCDEKEQADNERLRTLAEMDNFKKRLHREQEDFRKYAAENVLADLLPILDNLDLALQHGAKIEACKDVVLGVDMTRKMFLETLRNHGLVPVGEPGQEFDPNNHEAVGEDPRNDMEPGRVAAMMQKGYRLNERLLRPAKVIVSKAE